MGTKNGSVIFAEPPATTITPDTHLKYTESEIDLANVKLDGGILAKTLILSVDPYLRGKLRLPDGAAGPPPFELGKSYVSWTRPIYC